MDWKERNSKETGGKQEDISEPQGSGNDADPLEAEEIETAAQREAREKREEAERQEKARKRKLIPPFVTLSAGAVVSITMRIFHYEMQTMLVVLLCVLLGFYFVGRILQIMLDRFEIQIQEAHMEEGEVIEKEPSS